MKVTEFVLKNNAFEFNGTVKEQVLRYKLDVRLLMHAFL